MKTLLSWPRVRFRLFGCLLILLAFVAGADTFAAPNAAERLSNGGFENRLSGWQTSGAVEAISNPVRSGGGAARLNGTGGSASLSQSGIAIPANATSVIPTYWYRCEGYQNGSIRIHLIETSTGTPLWSGNHKYCWSAEPWAQESYSLMAGDIAAATRGKTVTLRLEGSDANVPVDDVSLMADGTSSSSPTPTPGTATRTPTPSPTSTTAPPATRTPRATATASRTPTSTTGPAATHTPQATVTATRTPIATTPPERGETRLYLPLVLRSAAPLPTATPTPPATATSVPAATATPAPSVGFTSVEVAEVDGTIQYIEFQGDLAFMAGASYGSGRLWGWNGSGWNFLPGSDSLPGLHALSVLPSGEAWAVGQYCAVVHRLGTTWYADAMPDTCGSTLNAVVANSASDVWAINGSLLVVHWDGSQWQRLADLPGTALGGAYDMAFFNSSHGFVVGNESATIGKIWHYENGNWREELFPNSPRLTGIAIRGAEGWIVGHNGATLRWEGGGWVQQPSTANVNFLDVYVAPDGRVFATAESISMLDAPFQVFQRIGEDWQPLPALPADVNLGYSPFQAGGIALGPDGSLWVGAVDAVVRYR